jgi:hypothetical protein
VSTLTTLCCSLMTTPLREVKRYMNLTEVDLVNATQAPEQRNLPCYY